MATRYNNKTGKILIDEDACRSDITWARMAISSLQSANRKLRTLSESSMSNFIGKTGDRFRASLAVNERKNNDEIGKIEEIIRQIESMINKYKSYDSQLAEKFRKG